MTELHLHERFEKVDIWQRKEFRRHILYTDESQIVLNTKLH